jgi:hypothetical protein
MIFSGSAAMVHGNLIHMGMGMKRLPTIMTNNIDSSAHTLSNDSSR